MSQIETELNNQEVKTDDRPIRACGYIILLFTFAFLGTWTFLAPIDGAAIAPGFIAVKYNSKTVQHLEGGIVKRLHVQEGMHVEAGDILLELDNTQRKAEKEQLNNSYTGLQALIKSQEHLGASYSEEIAELKGLLAEGFADKNQLRSLQREHSTVEARKSELRAQLSSVREKLIIVNDVLERTLIRSPVKGTVLGLKQHTEGGIINSGTPLLQIVPDGQALIIKAQVSPVDIDRVHVGFNAEVLLSAFNQSVTPKLLGTVINLSADRLINEKSGMPYYEAVLELHPESIQDLVGLELLPGMPAEVLISTGERTLLQYLGKPVTDAFARSFIED